jgi:hypothetical protein
VDAVVSMISHRVAWSSPPSNGRQYTAGQNLFDHVEDVAQDRFVEEDWALLTCEGGERAYILLADLRLDDAGERAPGISDVGPGRLGYGKARDLTAAEARELERAGRK